MIERKFLDVALEGEVEDILRITENGAKEMLCSHLFSLKIRWIFEALCEFFWVRGHYSWCRFDKINNMFHLVETE